MMPARFRSADVGGSGRLFDDLGMVWTRNKCQVELGFSMPFTVLHLRVLEGSARLFYDSDMVGTADKLQVQL